MRSCVAIVVISGASSSTTAQVPKRRSSSAGTTSSSHIRKLRVLASLADVVYYDADLADLCGPVTGDGVPDPHPRRAELLFLELTRLMNARQSGDNRERSVAEMFETIDPASSGIHALGWGSAGRSRSALSPR